MRKMINGMMGGRQAIFADGDFEVTEHSTGADGTCDVAAGQLFVRGTDVSNQGLYYVVNDATVNLAFSAADPTNDRIDLVIVEIQDSFYAGGANQADLTIVAGTPAGSPVVPDLDALGYENYFVLAQVLVNSGGGTVVADSDITDRRRSYASSQYGLATAAGGIVICTSTTRPPSPHAGLTIFETDTLDERVWDGTIWRHVSGPGNPYALASIPSNQTVTNGSTDVVNFTTQEADTDGFHDGSSAKFTIPAGMSGFYTVSTVINTSANLSGRRYLGIYLGSAANYIVRNYMDPSGAGASHIMSASATAYIAAGTEVYCNYYQDSGASITIGPGSGSGLIGKMNIVKVG